MSPALLMVQGDDSKTPTGLVGEHIVPTFKGDAYNCPHCGAYAHQQWTQLGYRGYQKTIETLVWRARCARCSETTFWHESGEAMIYPRYSTAPPPSPDMPSRSAEFYHEARNVLDASPRAAAALLRSCIEQLLIDLGYDTGTLDSKIGRLVKDGLPERYQKLFDAVRITGNGIHPGLKATAGRWLLGYSSL